MKKEQPYQFREFLETVHLPHRRSETAVSAGESEVLLDESWAIFLPENIPEGIRDSALDFQDYLFTSMEVPVRIAREDGDKVIAMVWGDKTGSRSYQYECTPNRITVRGESWLGVQQGLIYLEDLMNLRELPALEITSAPIIRSPLFSPRMTHSGLALDCFTDAQLATIVHAGFDSILLYATGPDRAREQPHNFNDTIRRAARFGLSTYLYGYVDSYKHPDESDAEEFFENNYGALFRHSPEARGIILVSESCEFPTKDSRAAGRTDFQGICSCKNRSSAWPCFDYPQWIDAVKKAVRKYNPEADVVFWTYCFGRAPEEAQREFVRNLSHDITLLVTFEMFDQVPREDYTLLTCDYTVTYPGPGRMFICEADEAARHGLKLYGMTNTAGRTWDHGVCPYIPVPQQWFKRYANMHKARMDWNLSGLMESHHYGWYPSVITECSKWSFWSPAIDMNEILAKIAVRDFGPQGGPLAAEAWQTWSEAIEMWIPSFGDQAGPLRAGAAYPLVFLPYLYPHVESGMPYPATPIGRIGAAGMFHPTYFPEQVYGATCCGKLLQEDLKQLPRAIALWRKGEESMAQAVSLAPPEKKENAERIYGVGKFFRHGIQTMLNVKKWFILNRKLEIEPDYKQANQYLDDMLLIIEDEMQNVREALVLAENDSVLGWEPRMDYVGGAWHLNWKIRQLENLRDNTIRAYRQTVQPCPPLDFRC